MLARSCHRVSLTTRGPAFRHLRSRHPPVPVFPFRGLASARKKMDSLGGLGPSDSDFPRRRGCFVLWCRFVFYFRRVTLDSFCFFARRTLWTRFLFYFRVLWTRFVFLLPRQMCGHPGVDAIPALQASQSEGRRARSGASSTPRSSTVGVVARAQSALPGLSRAGANSSSSFAPRATGTATRWQAASLWNKEEAAAGIMRHRTRESSDTKRTN